MVIYRSIYPDNLTRERENSVVVFSFFDRKTFEFSPFFRAENDKIEHERGNEMGGNGGDFNARNSKRKLGFSSSKIRALPFQSSSMQLEDEMFIN